MHVSTQRTLRSTALRMLLLACVAACSLAAQGQAGGSAAAPPDTGPSEAELKALAGLAPYAPAHQVNGTIRLWGHGAPLLDFMGQLVHNWQVEFEKFQPGIKFEYDMYGTASAMGALYAGKGDIAILGQEIYPFETVAFNRVKHYSPTEIEIATGSVDVRNFDFALGAFVNKENPLQHLTLEQLNRIFAYQDDPATNILTWGQLGLTGEWADKPIHLHGWHQADIFSTFIQSAALHGNHRWRCEMRQYSHIHRPDGTIYDSGLQILEEVAKDPYAIGLSNVRYLVPNVRSLALGRSPDGPFYQPTKSTLIDRQYPLGRIIPAEIDRRPGQPVDPAVKEFLTYLLSREGQAQIVHNGKYLPMQPAAARRQLEKLR